LFGDSRLYGTGYCSLVKDGRLYLGTNQGLYVTSFPVRPYPKPSTMQLFDRVLGQVWSLQEIDGVLFCATDRGLFTIRGNTAERIPQVDGTWKLIELKSHPGYLLGSSYRGFFLLKKEQGRWRYSHAVKDFEDSGGMFEEDPIGNIWFCHWMKGIFKLTFDSERLDHFAVDTINTQKGLYTNQNNVLVKIDNDIIVSSDGGFFQYNYESDRIEHARKYEQIFGIHPHSMRITQLSSGDIWCISAPYFALALQQEDGGYRVDTSSFNYLKNKLVMGFEDFNLIDYNTILVSTEDGFSWLDMGKARLAEHSDTLFQVMIKNVFITNEKDSLVAGFQLTPLKINEFKYKHNSIRFAYIAPEYRDEKAVTYSYMLENYDADWSAYSQTNVKEYTKLPKGIYTFKVRAKNFLESETAETTYTFTILPPWYESPAFILIYILLAIGSLFLLVLYVKRKSEEGAREMEIRKEQEMKEQEELFTASTKEKEKEIVALKNQKLQYELRHKSQELANSTMNLIRKNEMLQDLNTGIDKIYHVIDKDDTSKTTLMIRKQLQGMQQEIKQNIERDDNWKKFEENFDMIYENYLKRLKMQHPELSKNDLKLCAYLKMGLSSKDIAPLLNLSFRSIEMCRYRLRKKINLDRDTNLTTYLQNF
jgi:DNA-binding CsgD family transcriptional regulator